MELIVKDKEFREICAVNSVHTVAVLKTNSTMEKVL